MNNNYYNHIIVGIHYIVNSDWLSFFQQCNKLASRLEPDPPFLRGAGMQDYELTTNC